MIETVPELHDVLVIGGGPVGATLSLYLRRSGLRVTVLEARESDATPDKRALALSHGSRQALDELDVWKRLTSFANPIAAIHVSQRYGLGRAVLRAQDAKQDALGYILPHDVLCAALDQELRNSSDIEVLYGSRAESIKADADKVVVQYRCHDEVKALHARFVVLADGGRSVEYLPELKREVKDYGQHAVVANVTCEVDHFNMAYERFTPQGPVALLPNGEKSFVLVWTASEAEATALRDVEPSVFLKKLHAHFGDRVGKFLEVSGRLTFPLRLSYVRPVTTQRLAVIGNAAQTLHPVAGQGFNMGMRDAQELASIIRGTLPDQLGLEPMLAKYRRARRSDTLGGIAFTDFLVRTFSNDIPGLGLIRGAGIALLDFAPPLKRYLVEKMSFGVRTR